MHFKDAASWISRERFKQYEIGYYLTYDAERGDVY